MSNSRKASVTRANAHSNITGGDELDTEGALRLGDRGIISQPSRDEFLAAIFQGHGPDEHISLGCRKPCTKYWGYEAWTPGKEPKTSICYYSPVTVSRAGRARKLSAKAEFRQTCYAVVLDDVATKVDKSLIKLQPSYILETSPGNFQYGYILATPLPVKQANAIVRGLIDAGLTDRGRTNLSAHVMRVPGSLNDKYAEPFYAKVISWDAGRRFEAEDITTGLSIVAREIDYSAKEVSLPPGVTDPIFDWLQANGRILGERNAAGWYPTLCPWSEEHTTGDLGVDYKPGSPGAFKCLHSHGLEKNTRVFTDWVETQFPGARDILKSTVDRARASLTPNLQTISTIDGHIDTVISPPFFIDMTKSKLFPDPTGEKREQYYDAVFKKRDAKKSAAAFLEADLVHVNSDGAYYSFSVGGFVEYRSLDATFAPIINTTGLLDYKDDNGKDKRLSMLKWLARNDRVISVARSVLRPGEGKFVGDAVNIAKPFLVHDIPEEVAIRGIDAIGPFTDLLHHVINNPKQEEHTLDWLACVTSCVEKPGHAVVISSEVHGVGKNLISGTIGMIVGPDYSTTVSQTILQSAFNPYDAARWVVLNETRTTSRGSATLHDIEGKMKVSLSNDGEDITINDKNVKHFSAKNISCWFCTSNETVPFQLDKGDRRFYVVKSDAKILPSSNAIAYIEWRKNGGVALLAGCLRMRWESMSAADRARVMGPAPMTDAKAELIEFGDNSYAGSILMAASGEHPCYVPEVVAFDDLMQKIKDEFHRFGLCSPAAGSSFNVRKLQIALMEMGATGLGRVALEGSGQKKSLFCLSTDPARIRYWKAMSPATLRDRWMLIRDSRPGETIEHLIQKRIDAKDEPTPPVFKIHFPKTKTPAPKGKKAPK